MGLNPAMGLLSVTGIRRSFYGVVALAGVDLTVRAGTITGLIGPNGAGKTTLFNVISGLLAPDAGTIAFDGRDITGWRPDRITAAGLVRTFQIARGFPRLSVRENLMLYAPDQPGEGVGQALLRGGASAARERALSDAAARLAERLALDRVLDAPASELSGGQKKLLELGRALMAQPRLVLLDEPAAGVNPTLAATLAEHIRALAREGTTFLVIEHDMALVRQLCDPVIVMTEGRHLIEGSFAAVRADRRVQEAYLGVRA
jgi:branched-chain amino acid transport system ATP-binding protein/neutral amino acid transport system ATP-binding protein